VLVREAERVKIALANVLITHLSDEQNGKIYFIKERMCARAIYNFVNLESKKWKKDQQRET
jgi:hypothetical protein